MSAPARGAAASQFVLVASFGVTAALGLALTVLLGRHLDPADFGFFALVGAILAFSRDATDLGTGTAASRDMARDPASERVLLEGLYFVRRAVAFLLALAVAGFAAAEHDPPRRAVLVGTCAVLAIMGSTAWMALFQARQALQGPALAAVTTQGLLLAGCAWLVALGYGAAPVTGLLVLREAAYVAAIAWLGHRLLGSRIVPRLHAVRVRAFYAAAGAWAVAALLRHLFVQTDVLSIYLARGEAELGSWAAAYRIVSPVAALPWVVVAPLVPLLVSRQATGGAPQVLASALRLALGVGSLLAVCGFAVAPDLVAILYGGRYASGDLAAEPALRWIALGLAPGCLCAVLAAGLLAAGRERSVLAVSAAGLAFKIAANAILVPRFGFVAAAMTAAAVELLAALGLWWHVRGIAAPLSSGLAQALLPAALAALAAWAVAAGIALPAMRVVLLTLAGMAGLALLLRSDTGREYLRQVRSGSAAPRAGR